jgi:hypothetical protein
MTALAAPSGYSAFHIHVTCVSMTSCCDCLADNVLAQANTVLLAFKVQRLASSQSRCIGPCVGTSSVIAQDAKQNAQRLRARLSIVIIPSGCGVAEEIILRFLSGHPASACGTALQNLCGLYGSPTKRFNPDEWRNVRSSYSSDSGPQIQSKPRGQANTYKAVLLFFVGHTILPIILTTS